VRNFFARASLVVVALAIGFAGAFVVHRVADRQETTRPQVANVRGALSNALADLGAVGNSSVDAAPVAAPDVDPPDLPAGDPGDAVRRFLTLEVARDHAGSYGLLSAADRIELTSRAAWVAEHADLPAVTGFAVDAVHPAHGRADVVTRLTLHPQVSSEGVVPARAAATFTAVAEDGGWRVAFRDSTLEPQYAPATRAPDAVRAWARARLQCRRGTVFSGGLLGAPARADALCGAHGAVRTGRVRTLPETAQDQPFLAAFGSDVHDWARVVPIVSPVRLDVVVAPLGEHWLVVGVLQAPSEPS
jgi:hypothetical protein